MLELKKITISQILRDYQCKDDCFTEDTPLIRQTKYIINNKLSRSDRMIIVLYAELQSYRKVGKLLGVSHTTTMNEIKRIKALIKEQL